ncbi:hypothetical protein [Micromonospora deserti]|uniref:Uncharacterized protein n=1 Tax=Micromonospora deserti TaxID=2070366 RepID=A0A2W2CG15_9ACTN|nr:hypothetical protein [Micromonospora deserti]PZF87147.1 hypothetical protein C1I99_27925 [Micromonospora deserti]
MPVIHHPRVAWDTARVLVGAVPDDDLFDWLTAKLGDLLGPDCEQALRETRDRLWWTTDNDLFLVEAGRWRVRLEEALRSRPQTAEPLWQLSATATRLLRERRVAA